MADKTPTTTADDLPPDEQAALDDAFAQAGADEPELKPPSLVAALKAQGFDLDDDADDASVLSRIEELEKRDEDYDRVSARARQLETWYQQSQHAALPRTEPKPETPAASEQPAAAKPDVPEWDPSWEGYLKYNDQGDIVPKEPWVSAELVSKYKRRKAWERDQLQRILEKPSDFFRDAGALPDTDALRKQLREELRQELLEDFRQHSAQEQTASSLKEYGQQHREHFYNADGSFTETGAFMHERLVELAQKHQPAKAIRYAEDDYLEEFGQTPPWRAAAADAEGEEVPAPEDRRRKLQRKARTNGRLTRIAQPPVATRRGGQAEIVQQPTSIREAGQKFYESMLQTAGGEEE